METCCCVDVVVAALWGRAVSLLLLLVGACLYVVRAAALKLCSRSASCLQAVPSRGLSRETWLPCVGPVLV